MIINIIKKYNITKKTFIITFSAISVSIYCILYMIYSDKGLLKYFSLKKEINNSKIIKSKINNKIKYYNNKIDLMKQKSLDIDLLNEKSKEDLGQIEKGEIIININEIDEISK